MTIIALARWVEYGVGWGIDICQVLHHIVVLDGKACHVQDELVNCRSDRKMKRGHMIHFHEAILLETIGCILREYKTEEGGL